MTSIRLGEKLENKLNLASKRENKSKSEIIKEAREIYLTDLEKQQHPYELGKELFGKYGSGKGNLSKEYKEKVKEKIREKIPH
ncbi:MAG: ribbon-helix-helix protein, CopG family [Firmicutes bacterium]|nr:ribbon-helix-helix protein, CopG family [Bacillota bacterium]